MKIKTKCIDALDNVVKLTIALRMDVTAQTVDRWLKENEEDGPLTKLFVIDIIENLTSFKRNDIIDYSFVKQ